MAPARKKKIGFDIASKETEKKKPKLKLMGPEGPMLSVLRIAVSPFQLNAIKNSKFLRLKVRSRDGKFALDLILKDSDAFLDLVPKKIPAISVNMELDHFYKNVEPKTIVMLLDGLGHSKGFKMVDIKPVELYHSSWFPRKEPKMN
jgi:hypothetical protein